MTFSWISVNCFFTSHQLECGAENIQRANEHVEKSQQQNSLPDTHKNSQNLPAGVQVCEERQTEASGPRFRAQAQAGPSRQASRPVSPDHLIPVSLSSGRSQGSSASTRSMVERAGTTSLMEPFSPNEVKAWGKVRECGSNTLAWNNPREKERTESGGGDGLCFRSGSHDRLGNKCYRCMKQL